MNNEFKTNNPLYPNFSFKHIIPILVVILLSSCGGGGSSNPGDGSTPGFLITANASIGGNISPSSITVNQGETTTFTVVPESDFTIANITGCNGTLSANSYTTGTITGVCTVNANFVSNSTSILNIADSSTNEGNNGTTNLTFTVTLSKPASSDVTVNYSTSSISGIGNATTGIDYIEVSNTLTIPVGNSSGEISVTINADTNAEPDEILTVTLSSPTGASLGIATATGTIINDDTQTGINTPPTTNIIGWQTVSDKSRRFSGEGLDAEDGILSGISLVWSSNIDGTLGTGAVINTSTLTPGTHSISLTATDSKGASSSTSIIIFINQWPTTLFTSPTDGSSFNNIDDITFVGSAIDPEDGVLSGTSLVWKSNKDGNLGTGESITTKLSIGTHFITLTAADSMNFVDAKSILLSVSSIAWNSETDIPFAYPDARSAVIDNKIYVIGNVALMQIYDPTSTTWSTTTSPGGTNICASNGKLFSFGRLVLTNSRTTPKTYEAIGVDEYNPATDTWTIKTNLLSQAGSPEACLEVNGKIYLVGTKSGAFTYDGVYEYTPATEVLTAKSRVPSERRYFGSSVVNGKIYLMGGSASGSTSSSWYTSTVYEYDPTLNSWTTKTAMPTSRKRLTAAAHGGKIYAFGGYNSNGFSNDVEEYDPATNTWTVKSKMLMGRRSMASSYLGFDNRIYVIAGNVDPNQTRGLTLVESYDPALD